MTALLKVERVLANQIVVFAAHAHGVSTANETNKK